MDFWQKEADRQFAACAQEARDRELGAGGTVFLSTPAVQARQGPTAVHIYDTGPWRRSALLTCKGASLIRIPPATQEEADRQFAAREQELHDRELEEGGNARQNGHALDENGCQVQGYLAHKKQQPPIGPP